MHRVMMDWEYDDERDGFPKPLRKDGRSNHWYWKKVEEAQNPMILHLDAEVVFAGQGPGWEDA